MRWPRPAFDAVTTGVDLGTSSDAVFAAFTGATDRWWPRGRRYRVAHRSVGWLGFEGERGGALVERWTNARGQHAFQVGAVTAWEPGRRVVLAWRQPSFADGEQTELDVGFAAQGGRTAVTLIERGWEAMPAEHVSRHRLEGAPFVRDRAAWWARILLGLADHLAEPRAPARRTRGGVQ
jgi:uncharacterized protein YndB with AHSA1/START domain